MYGEFSNVIDVAWSVRAGADGQSTVVREDPPLRPGKVGTAPRPADRLQQSAQCSPILFQARESRCQTTSTPWLAWRGVCISHSLNIGRLAVGALSLPRLTMPPIHQCEGVRAFMVAATGRGRAACWPTCMATNLDVPPRLTEQ